MHCRYMVGGMMEGGNSRRAKRGGSHLKVKNRLCCEKNCGGYDIRPESTLDSKANNLKFCCSKYCPVVLLLLFVSMAD